MARRRSGGNYRSRSRSRSRGYKSRTKSKRFYTVSRGGIRL